MVIMKRKLDACANTGPKWDSDLHIYGQYQATDSWFGSFHLPSYCALEKLHVTCKKSILPYRPLITLWTITVHAIWTSGILSIFLITIGCILNLFYDIRGPKNYLSEQSEWWEDSWTVHKRWFTLVSQCTAPVQNPTSWHNWPKTDWFRPKKGIAATMKVYRL